MRQFGNRGLTSTKDGFFSFVILLGAPILTFVGMQLRNENCQSKAGCFGFLMIIL